MNNNNTIIIISLNDTECIVLLIIYLIVYNILNNA